MGFIVRGVDCVVVKFGARRRRNVGRGRLKVGEEKERLRVFSGVT